MPKVVDAEAQRREIRRAALAVFGERGVAATGLAHVAASAGMGRSSLYHYYATKQELVRDLVAELLVREEALFAGAAGGEEPPLERIGALLDALVGLGGDWARVGPLLTELRSLEAERFRGFFRRARRHLAALVREGQRRGEFSGALAPERAATHVIGLVDGLLLQALVDPERFGDAEAERRALRGSVERMLAP